MHYDSGYYDKIKFKRNGKFISKNNFKDDGQTLVGSWEIKNDTIFLVEKFLGTWHVGDRAVSLLFRKRRSWEWDLPTFIFIKGNLYAVDLVTGREKAPSVKN